MEKEWTGQRASVGMHPRRKEWFTAPELLEAQVTTKRVSETGGGRGGDWQASLFLIQMLEGEGRRKDLGF